MSQHKSTSIVFFGSGPVAADSLRFLNETFTIEAVVTKPVTEEEMKQITPSTPIHTVKNRQELTDFVATKPFQSNVGIIVDFGIIVEQPVIDYFFQGIVNSHFSLLPRWRGADPISFSILEGDDKTGVSLMLIDEQLDTGKLIGQKSLPITKDDTTPSLTKKLIGLSNEMLGNYLPRYIAGEIKPHTQPHPDRATYSRKLTKQDGVLDFNKPASQLEREIRAFVGWPGSRTTLAGRDVIITKAYTVPSRGTNDKPGHVTVVPEARTIAIATSDGSLWLERLKPAGKNEMPVAAFLAGYSKYFAEN
jgi:methionyl-tRNA formyltransferase